MAIKVAKGRLELGCSFAEFMATELAGFNVLPASLSHVAAVAELPHRHSDPFDRLLVAQALQDNLSIVSVDPMFDACGVTHLWD